MLDHDPAWECLDQLLHTISDWSIRHQLPSAAEIEDTKRQVNLLLYLSSPRQGWTVSPAPNIHAPICAAPSCKAGWREGLINFAAPENDPVWYCIKHGVIEGGHTPPGSLPDQKVIAKTAADMLKKWAAFNVALEERQKKTAEQLNFDWREK